MFCSATTPAASRRDAKRRETTQRIADCAQRLAATHGLDGFTMDDLAREADVSRRTLFNYFPSKLDAVLGLLPDLTEQTREEFVGGGPHGDLVADLAVLAREILHDHSADHGLDRARIERTQQLITTTPRLLLTVHERFEEISAAFVDLVHRRDPGLDPVDARLLVHLLVAVFDSAMAAYVAGEDSDLADLFDHRLVAARRLFS